MAADPQTQQTVMALLVQALPIVTAIVAGVWVLRNSLTSLEAKFSSELSALRVELTSTKTEVAVLREREDARAEKTDKMWEWWLLAIEHGWIAHIKSVDVEKRTGLDRRGT